MILMRLYFPIASDRAAALVGVAAEMWPGCFSGVEPDAIVISDEPMGKDPVEAGRATEEMIEAHSRPKGQRWGERSP